MHHQSLSSNAGSQKQQNNTSGARDTMMQSMQEHCKKWFLKYTNIGLLNNIPVCFIVYNSHYHICIQLTSIKK